jgi:hypothetical protein
MKIRAATIVIVVSFALVLLGRGIGHYLVLENPEQGDVIVVLAGDQNDKRYHRGLEVLRGGKGRLLLVDSNVDIVQFGRTLAALEEEYIQRSAGTLVNDVRVCPIEGDSTDEETKYVQLCLQNLGVKSVVLVTSDFHTRRALSVFGRRLPRYHWSTAAARDEARFGEKWWQHREWAKTTLLESTKLIWWEIVDRWRNPTNLPLDRATTTRFKN